jgi:outer membrane lipoprotein-sorting protein
MIRLAIQQGFLLVSLAAAAGAQTLDQILTRMDQNAATFKSMSAKLQYLSYVDVIKETSVSKGTLMMKRSRKDATVLVNFTEPDPKTVAVAGSKVEIYLPRLNTVQEYDLGKSVEKYLALGFGASGKELRADYALQLLGVETANGQKAAHLELIPKSKEVLRQLPRIELWISDETGYPVQEKLHQTGGDYMLATYTDVAINPRLPDSAFKLNLPKDVKHESPGKK